MKLIKTEENPQIVKFNYMGNVLDVEKSRLDCNNIYSINLVICIDNELLLFAFEKKKDLLQALYEENFYDNCCKRYKFENYYVESTIIEAENSYRFYDYRGNKLDAYFFDCHNSMDNIVDVCNSDACAYDEGYVANLMNLQEKYND